MFKLLPPMRLTCGDGDPLFLDSIRFLKRATDLEKDINLTIYNQYPHGFLSFGPMMKDSKTIISDAVKLIWELFNK